MTEIIGIAKFFTTLKQLVCQKGEMDFWKLSYTANLGDIPWQSWCKILYRAAYTLIGV